jgi:hypothetical protein
VAFAIGTVCGIQLQCWRDRSVVEHMNSRLWLSERALSSCKQDKPSSDIWQALSGEDR